MDSVGGPEPRQQQQQREEEGGPEDLLQGVEDGVLWGTTINVQTCMNIFKWGFMSSSALFCSALFCCVHRLRRRCTANCLIDLCSVL
jgi:hypothetical protein